MPDDRRRGGRHDLVALLQRSARGGQQPADVRRGKAHGRHGPAVVDLHVLGLITGNDMPPSGTRLPRDAAAGAGRSSTAAPRPRRPWTRSSTLSRLPWPSSEISVRAAAQHDRCRTGAPADRPPGRDRRGRRRRSLSDDVDDPRFHRRHGHLGAVDGQRHGLVGRWREPPANVSASNVTKTSTRRWGDRDSWSLFNVSNQCESRLGPRFASAPAH